MSFNLTEKYTLDLIEHMFKTELRYYTNHGISKEELTNVGICAILSIYSDKVDITQKELEMETLKSLRRFIYHTAQYRKRKRDLLLNSDVSGHLVEDTIEESFTEGPEEDIIQNNLIKCMMKKVEILDARSRYVISQIYLISTPRTLEDIGEELGISKQRVSVIRDNALEKLKHELIND